MKTSTAIRLILADDHELFRDGFSVIIKKQPHIDLVAEANNGEELLRLTYEHRPEVIITDIKMPGLDGVAVVQRLKKEWPHIGVIALTQYDEDALIVDMLEAGARGYLLKSAGKDEILEAIENVYNQKTHYCRQTSAKLSQLIANRGFYPHRGQKKIAFSERETTVIQLTCQGFTNKEIAAQLFLSKRTIETHRENILEKIDETSTAGLIVYAIKHGIYKP